MRTDAGRLLVAYLELQLPMIIGAGACLLIGGLLRTSPTVATVYHPGGVAYFIGDLLFLTLPVVAWTAFRGRGTRRGLELALAMLVPVAVIVAVGQAARVDYLTWLVVAMYPAMSLGIAIYMLRDAARASLRGGYGRRVP